MLVVGFTGTRGGMTPQQISRVTTFLKTYKPHTVHHGGCIGADAQFHEIAQEQGIKTHAHWANMPDYRAEIIPDISHPERPPLKRNRDIVDASTIVLATPKGYVEQRRGSGTWATINYSRVEAKGPIIFYPNGVVGA